ncbi:hypothetical protein RYX56_05665 [Alkalihalophilus lindianensis]|uniref:Uncharacterized protein n=1 Tax=Alkalihalophilus lindianensis TaxID=1630542 RepID=A0ABU3X7J8_9BACI|nr:hypothetical protein [Alkalihalophilus lindianensis]MDV2683796.1 hypothetical protein [Alkalihalophilus lindianensis]MDV2683862.1 hypothetical protein [Alkalihalophilus lindianensis]
MSQQFEIQITGTNIRYADGGISSVHVQFQARDPKSQINLSGYIPLEPEEYHGNEAMDSLRNVIKQKIIDRINGVEEAPAE